jgi:hypothetical protein
MQDKFDDIRPYYDSEVPEAMQRIAASEHFGLLSRYIFPDRDVEDVRRMVSEIRSVYEFQEKMMYAAHEQILHRSTTGITFEGFEHLDPEKSYIFISNHRDIMLDSSLLQYRLFNMGLKTTEITFGSNLMHPQLVVDIGKSNKMFKVVRSINIREFLKNSLHLSEYIRYTITEKGESVWIAQRNGRTKDGNDATDQGIIKMFCMSDTADLRRSLDCLNIVPVAVSYQIESCDMLKTRELYLTRNGDKYVKQPNEDLNSILTGIMQPKGGVNISVCKPLDISELQYEYRHPNEFYKTVASIIDARIYANYKLFDNNYIAYDMLHESDTYSEYYTPEAKTLFEARCEAMLKQIEGDRDVLMRIFLGIYANPVSQKHKN